MSSRHAFPDDRPQAEAPKIRLVDRLDRELRRYGNTPEGRGGSKLVTIRVETAELIRNALGWSHHAVKEILPAHLPPRLRRAIEELSESLEQ